jgi:hypothetical protein
MAERPTDLLEGSDRKSLFSVGVLDFGSAVSLDAFILAGSALREKGQALIMPTSPIASSGQQQVQSSRMPVLLRGQGRGGKRSQGVRYNASSTVLASFACPGAYMRVCLLFLLGRLPGRLWRHRAREASPQWPEASLFASARPVGHRRAR